jgi:heme oxygenase
MLLGQLLPIYDALDRGARVRRDHPVVGPLLVDPLARPSHVEAELRTLLGPGWRAACGPIPAGQAYLDRLQEVAFTWPGGLVAHHFMRSLGELSATRLAAYRDRLDLPAWDGAEQRRVVEECRRALRLQRDLFCAVGPARETHLVA